MAFKKIPKNDIVNEEKFLNSARGDVREQAKKQEFSKVNKKPCNEKLKRKYSLSVYFSEEEMLELKEKAEEIKMNVNQYIRFKIFTNFTNYDNQSIKKDSQ